MRSQLLLVGLLASGVALVGMVACSSDTVHEVIVDGGGGGNGDATIVLDDGAVAEPTYDLPSDVLLKGSYVLLSLIGDQAIIRDLSDDPNATIGVYSLPIAGGTPTKIFDVTSTDGIGATPGALAHWSNVNNGVGTLDVWTPASGLKTGIAQNSVSGSLFTSSDDGTRIAFTQDAVVAGTTIESASLAVRDLASSANLVTLSGATDGMNLAAAENDCAPRIEFTTGASKIFFADYCTGTDPKATAARLYTVAGTATATAVRLDDPTDANPNTLLGSRGFTTDNAGDKVAWVDATSTNLKVISVATPSESTVLDTAARDILMLGDGSAVIYATAATTLADGGIGTFDLKKATVAATPVLSTLATNMPGIAYVDGTADGMKLVFAEQEDSTNGTTDLHLIDFTQATPTVVDLVTGTTGAEVGFTADSKSVVWADIATAAGAVRSLTIGGAPKDVAPGLGGMLSDTGSALAIFTDAFEEDQVAFVDVGYVDALAGGTPKSISIDVPVGHAVIKNNRLIYTKAFSGDEGIFAITLP